MVDVAHLTQAPMLRVAQLLFNNSNRKNSFQTAGSGTDACTSSMLFFLYFIIHLYVGVSITQFGSGLVEL